MNIVETGGIRVMLAPETGAPLGSEQDALDLIGEAYGREAELIAIPVARLDPDFLRLRSGLAGSFLQKMQNYTYRVAIVGDISGAVAESRALRDFVYESNKVGTMLFAADMDDLARRLQPRAHEGITR